MQSARYSGTRVTTREGGKVGEIGYKVDNCRVNKVPYTSIDTQNNLYIAFKPHLTYYKMHVSGLTKRNIFLAVVGAVATEEVALKMLQKGRPRRRCGKRERTTRVAEIRVNIDLARYVSEGGSESDDHGDEDGILAEVKAEDDREAAREAGRVAYEERMQDLDMERWEKEVVDEAAKDEKDIISVEEIEGSCHVCSPPDELDDQEKDAWEDTAEFVKLCRKTSTKVPVKIPSDLDGKLNKAHK